MSGLALVSSQVANFRKVIELDYRVVLRKTESNRSACESRTHRACCVLGRVSSVEFPNVQGDLTHVG